MQEDVAGNPECKQNYDGLAWKIHKPNGFGLSFYRNEIFEIFQILQVVGLGFGVRALLFVFVTLLNWSSMFLLLVVILLSDTDQSKWNTVIHQFQNWS